MNIRNYFKTGEAFVWLNAGAVTISIIMIVGIMSLLAVRGLSYFWPADILQATYQKEDGAQPIMGELYKKDKTEALDLREAGRAVPKAAKDSDMIETWSIKAGNKNINSQDGSEIFSTDFVWVTKDLLQDLKYPKDAYRIERAEYGNFYGNLVSVNYAGKEYTGKAAQEKLKDVIGHANKLREQARSLERGEMNHINYERKNLKIEQHGDELRNELTAEKTAEYDKKYAKLDADFAGYSAKLEAVYAELKRDSAVFTIANGQPETLLAENIFHAEQPNKMGVFGKTGAFLGKVFAFLSEDPRESNTEGGIFPAIFGTILMVFIMTIVVTPLGVVAAVYLREYAKQGPFTQLVRICVNNLAGVPSIVYGVFGLGFFVYFVGAGVDTLFFPAEVDLKQPVYGTPGLLWASVTLALLTLPLVIVSTEEGLSRIPRSLKEGSLALGATKFETLWKVVLPMSAPAIMTGMILAIARAAGEVAPLMLVGVVKIAPELPLDGNFPFLHLDRKFMHLGYHIYDVGFKSPDAESVEPLVYATALLLVVVVAVLNIAAISIRNRLREKYKSLEN